MRVNINNIIALTAPIITPVIGDGVLLCFGQSNWLGWQYKNQTCHLVMTELDEDLQGIINANLSDNISVIACDDLPKISADTLLVMIDRVNLSPKLMQNLPLLSACVAIGGEIFAVFLLDDEQDDVVEAAVNVIGALGFLASNVYVLTDGVLILQATKIN